MSHSNLSSTSGTAPAQQNLTPNEKAIIESIRIPLLRKLFAVIWRVKLRLQFTGWLQYMPFSLLALVCLLAAGLASLLGVMQAAMVLGAVGLLLLAAVAFDLATVKFQLRPTESLPTRNDDLDLFDLMRVRHSCRSYQTRKLTPADHQELMASVARHTSAPQLGTSPVRFEYISAPLTVWPVVNATEFLVAIAPKQYDRLAVIDVGRSLQKIVIDATRMGLGTCWIGPGADHESIIAQLGERFQPAQDHIICVCAIGYESWFSPLFLRIFNAQLHRRLPLSSLFFADAQCTEPLDLTTYPFNRFGRTYEICQWAPSSYNGQTTRGVAVTEKNSEDAPMRLTRFDFYAVTASRYYAAVAVGIWCANWEMGCETLGIQGHLTVLPVEEKGGEEIAERIQLPRYDISWMLDEELIDYAD